MARTSDDEDILLEHVPRDGSGVGNTRLMELLGWSPERYWRVRDALVDKSCLAVGRGRGGSVRRVSGDEEQLLERVPEDGSLIGNSTLMAALRWSSERYWRVRNAMLDKGVLEKGRGRGGSVRRVIEQEVEPEDEEILAPSERLPDGGPVREAALYEPLRRVLETDWVRDQGLSQFVIEITAHQGRRATGGRWSRPDLTVASCRRFDHLPDRIFDIWTFEVKPRARWDLMAVHEAAAHGRFAMRVFAMLQVSDPMTPDEEQLLAACVREAQRLHVGVVTFVDPAVYETWEFVVNAERRSPDPEDAEEFISQQLSIETQDTIRRWWTTKFEVTAV
jgi:hypothetical protein